MNARKMAAVCIAADSVLLKLLFSRSFVVVARVHVTRICDRVVSGGSSLQSRAFRNVF